MNGMGIMATVIKPRSDIDQPMPRLSTICTVNNGKGAAIKNRTKVFAAMADVPKCLPYTSFL
jgi:hypothetical protein